MEEKLTSTLQMLNLNQQDSWRSNFNGKDQLNTVFHEICKDHVKYSDLFKALYEDKSSQNQLRCDMYLQLYYKFATALTKEISSIPNFLQSTTFPYAPDITYSSNDTSRRMFKKLHLEEKECLITYIAANKEINGKSNTADDPVVISKSSQILSNDFFTVGTRLEDFFILTFKYFRQSSYSTPRILAL